MGNIGRSTFLTLAGVGGIMLLSGRTMARAKTFAEGSVASDDGLVPKPSWTPGGNTENLVHPTVRFLTGTLRNVAPGVFVYQGNITFLNTATVFAGTAKYFGIDHGKIRVLAGPGFKAWPNRSGREISRVFVLNSPR